MRLMLWSVVVFFFSSFVCSDDRCSVPSSSFANLLCPWPPLSLSVCVCMILLYYIFPSRARAHKQRLSESMYQFFRLYFTWIVRSPAAFSPTLLSFFNVITNYRSWTISRIAKSEQSSNKKSKINKTATATHCQTKRRKKNRKKDRERVREREKAKTRITKTNDKTTLKTNHIVSKVFHDYKFFCACIPYVLSAFERSEFIH